MRKNEVARIKEQIESLKGCLDNPKSRALLSERDRIDFEARIDALVWVLAFTGNAEGLDPSLHPEEFFE